MIKGLTNYKFTGLNVYTIKLVGLIDILNLVIAVNVPLNAVLLYSTLDLLFVES